VKASEIAPVLCLPDFWKTLPFCFNYALFASIWALHAGAWKMPSEQMVAWNLLSSRPEFWSYFRQVAYFPSLHIVGLQPIRIIRNIPYHLDHFRRFAWQ
jgi:hypothetical protein